MNFFTRNRSTRRTSSTAGHTSRSPSVVSLSSTSTGSAFEMVANRSTCSSLPEALTFSETDTWQMDSPPRKPSNSPRSISRDSTPPPPTEEQLLEEYDQVRLELWPGVLAIDYDSENEEAPEVLEEIKGYVSAWAIPNSPTDGSLMFDFRADDLGLADAIIENTRGLQKPALPRERVALNVGTRFGYYAACNQDEMYKVDEFDFCNEEDEEDVDVDVLFDAEDPSTFVDWPDVSVVNLAPVGVVEQFERLAAQDLDVEEWSYDIVPYSDDERKVLGDEVQATRMRMYDQDTEREYDVEFDVQGNMTFCFDPVSVAATAKSMDVPKSRAGIDFLPGIEHLNKPIVRSAFVDYICVDKAQAPINTKKDQEVVQTSEDGVFVDITHLINSEEDSTSAPSSSPEEMTTLFRGVNFLPTTEPLADQTAHLICVDHQSSLPTRKADVQDEQDIVDIIDAYFDPDMLSDFSQDSEFTDITELIHATPYFYNADTQQEVGYHVPNSLLDCPDDLHNIPNKAFDSSSDESESESESQSLIKFEGRVEFVEPLQIGKAGFVHDDDEGKCMSRRKANFLKFVKPMLHKKFHSLDLDDDESSASSDDSVSFEGKREPIKPVEVRKVDFLDSDAEEGWKTHHRKAALRKLQGESGVEDWFLDDTIWQCDLNAQFDILESAFSEWSSDDGDDGDDDDADDEEGEKNRIFDCYEPAHVFRTSRQREAQVYFDYRKD